MQKTTCRLTVFFESPFWVGVYERTGNGRLEACKIIFGAEPKDCEVYSYLLEHWHTLRFSPAVRDGAEAPERKNPKRIQREITRQLSRNGTGTKSQQALQLQREEGKAARRVRSRQQREEEQRRRFALHRQKQREKRRGH